MHTRILKWGNSLGMRIPKPLAELAGVTIGSEVDLAVEDGALIVRPRRPPRTRYQLERLLRGVNSRNVHREVETGTPAGREIW